MIFKTFLIKGNMKFLAVYLIIILEYLCIGYLDAQNSFFFNETSLLQVMTTINTLKEEFDFGFRTCHGGTIFYQGGNGDDYILLQVSPGTVDYNISVSPPYFTPSQLTLQWKIGGVIGSVHAGNELDKSYFYKVTFKPGSTLVNATLTVDGPNSYSTIVPKYTLNFNSSGPMYVGGMLGNLSSIKGFVGCIESGRNFQLHNSEGATNVQSGCPNSQLLCARKSCAAGFTGYYCEVNMDECNSNPCHSYSTCEDGVNDYKCKCGQQWTGRDCNQFRGSLCDSKPCQNGGVCKETVDRNNYTCTCASGWSGRNCSSSFDPCALSPCFNNGTCYKKSILDAGYNCTCQSGFTGINCETNINDCATVPCNNGQCVDGINNYTCNCTGSGYNGSTCSQDIDECETLSCSNGATCLNYPGTYDCKCVRGFVGKNCEENFDDCSPNLCENGGNCTDKIDGFSCTCPVGFNGTRCENDIDDCVNNNCNRNQRCIDQINNYMCVCLPGFTGSNCSVDIGECLSNPCKNNGTCNEGVNGYNCSCLPRFNGTYCELDIINDCAIQRCYNNGTCIDGIADYQCNCTKGFHGKRCEKDICSPNPCENGGRCTTSKVNPFDFNCTCLQGFSGSNCSINIDECQSYTCVKNATCIDGINNYTCQCPSGYHGDFCQIDIDECASNPCQNNATCSNEIGHFNCSCLSGFNGRQCEVNIDDCPSHGCYNGTCDDGINNYTCICNEGFEGEHCDRDINECLNGSLCVNGGTCHNTIGSYHCECNKFTNGTRCELDINECRNKTLCNNGICENSEFLGYQCYCSNGWTGLHCQQDLDDCAINYYPCKNGASCKDGLAEYTCACTSGWEGRHCDQDINECALGYCKNGATCNNNNGSYNCMCVPGYADYNCSTDIDECVSQPCYNGATCNDYINYFNCSCVPGYTGHYCSIDIDECAGNPCKNNATCNNLINEFNCTCMTNYTGRLCEYPVSRCRPNNPCLNNGSCVDQGLDNYTCICLPGYGGKNCINTTTISMNGSSYMALNVGKSLLTISLQFRTTLRNGVLAVDAGGKFSLKLDGVGLLVSYDVDSITVGTDANLTDGQWHQVMVNLTAISIQVNIDNSSCSDCTKTMVRSSPTALSKLFIGGTKSRNTKLLIGCIRAVEIDGLTVIPTQSDVELVNVTSGCPRVPVCQPNPCVNGRCVDEWLIYRCECSRPWNGLQCNATFIAGTFGAKSILNNATRRRRSVVQQSFVKFSTPTTFSNSSELSFFIRTREENGLIAFFTGLSGNITLTLSNGAIFVQSTKGSHSKSLMLSPRVNDGEYHFVSVSVNESKVDNLTLPGISIPTIQLLIAYLGGLEDWNEIQESLVMATKGLRGCIQDMRLNNKLFLFYQDPTSLDSFTIIKREGLDKGCPGENICASSPCGSKGSCENIWNDFRCHCDRFYGGRNCSLYGCALVQPCDDGSQCVDRDNGQFECVSPATFNASLSRARFTFSSNATLKPQISFRMRTRQINAVIFTVSKNNQKLIVRVDNGTLNMTYDLGSTSGNVISTKTISDGVWHNLMVNLSNPAQLTIDDMGQSLSVQPFSGKSLRDLLQVTSLHVGSDTQIPFKGCLDNLQVGGALLPFKHYYNSSYNVSHVTPLKPHFDANLTGISLGCHRDDECSFSPCARGKCLDIWNAFKCVCPEGYAGKICNNTANMTCAHQPCFNNATCHNNMTAHLESSDQTSDFGKDRFVCQCLPGYLGRQCKEVTDECSSSPCQNEGNCTDLHLNFSCSCVPGYTGRLCEINIDECMGNNCSNNSICVDGVDMYSCNCTEGFNGTYCQQDIDECKLNVCYEAGKHNCTNTVGSYECECKQGYYGNNCEYNATEWCKVREPCHHGNCSGNSTGFFCACFPGWEGKTCENDIKECASNPCKNSGTCIDSNSPNQEFFPGYQCECSVDYTGRDCEKLVDPCNALPCLNGTCSRVTHNKYSCNCTEGFGNMNCSGLLKYCEPNPCVNNTRCIPLMDDYMCRCGVRYTGKNCSELVNKCDSNPCSNGGTCITFAQGYNCSCKPGFKGTNCQATVNYCETIECKHSAVCISMPEHQNYTCNCTEGYEGTLCQYAVNEPKPVKQDEPIGLVVGVVVACILLILLVMILVLLYKKRAGNGTYSPSKQEKDGGRVELNSVLKPPNQERLI